MIESKTMKKKMSLPRKLAANSGMIAVSICSNLIIVSEEYS